jgi:hypothetical protein
MLLPPCTTHTYQRQSIHPFIRPSVRKYTPTYTYIVARADKLGEARTPARDDVVGQDPPQVSLRIAARHRQGQLLCVRLNGWR